ncbi:MAG: BsuPI-related putative proteinase inhibitor [Bryobacterales bacterium]
MRSRFLILLITSIVCGAAQAANLFPLNPGSVWEYRAEGVQEPLVMRVSSNQLYLMDGRVYSHLTGYVDQPLWVRLDDAGDLVYLDEESSQDNLLTNLHVQDKFWFAAQFRPCEQEGQAHSDRVAYSGPTGSFPETLAVRYRSFSCADAGVEAELFAANVGMVSRTVSTIAGPVVYNLVYADTGSLQLAPRTAATLRLALDQDGERSVTARLRLSGDPDAAPLLEFSSSQEFDMALRDENGAVVWKWSNGQFFTEALHQRQAANLAYEANIPLEIGGKRLPGGTYTVEAWLTTTSVERAPRVSATFRLNPASESPKAIQPLRSRTKR